MMRSRIGAWMRKWADRIDPGPAREAAAQAHRSWVATASIRQLLDDALLNPSGERAGESMAEWHRRLNARMRGEIREVMRTADASLHDRP